MIRPPWAHSDVTTAAVGLLGWRLRSSLDGREVVVELTEVEAYGGEFDPASHAYRGPTNRNSVMFGPPGFLYVYLSYGIHWCMNVVTGVEGEASAVLLRGAAIVDGRDVVEDRRGRADRLTDGPGKLTQALGVTGDLDGHDLSERPLVLEPAQRRSPLRYAATERIGISKATERLWRFVVSPDSGIGPEPDDGVRD